ncbi:MAG TPA: ferritin-like domain-containing protein [Nitrospira sp.]|nr:ferritin-like domain-containing protein [Nitrospira sp.]
MKSPESMGMNRSGIDMSPQGAEQMVEAAREFPPSSQGGEHTLAGYRASYLTDAEPIGTMPVPGTVKGAAKAGMQKLMGRHAEVLIDKLGGRLAFERTGTRLYDALIGKLMVRKDEASLLPIEQLQHFRSEEAAHMELCWDALRQLGADPTCVTPMADTNAVASIGLMQIIADPRMTIAQSLHAIHVAELADNDGWLLLVKVAKEMGQDDMAARFRRALEEEDRHLSALRQWMEQICLNEAGVA